MRLGELKRAIEGISPRVLTLTLHSLERDGLVKRQSFATIPPRVDYSITELGKSLATAIKPVVLWGEQNETKFKNCQKKLRFRLEFPLIRVAEAVRASVVLFRRPASFRGSFSGSRPRVATACRAPVLSEHAG